VFNRRFDLQLLAEFDRDHDSSAAMTTVGECDERAADKNSSIVLSQKVNMGTQTRFQRSHNFRSKGIYLSG
jgi:hypothetical protein